MSERELEVLYLIAAGLSNREIAEKLFISLNTVNPHTKNINSKLNVTSRTKASAEQKSWGFYNPREAGSPATPARLPLLTSF